MALLLTFLRERRLTPVISTASCSMYGFNEEYAKLYEANRELIDNFLVQQVEAVRNLAG
jgi:hypothetical protein